MPVILVLSVIGSWAIRNNLTDVFWMFGFGVLGYFMKKYDFPAGPMVLGIILCNLFETNLIRGVKLNGSLGALLLSIFTSPVSVVLLILIILSFIKRKDSVQ